MIDPCHHHCHYLRSWERAGRERDFQICEPANFLLLFLRLSFQPFEEQILLFIHPAGPYRCINLLLGCCGQEKRFYVAPTPRRNVLFKGVCSPPIFMQMYFISFRSSAVIRGPSMKKAGNKEKCVWNGVLCPSLRGLFSEMNGVERRGEKKGRVIYCYFNHPRSRFRGGKKTREERRHYYPGGI